MKRFFDIFVGLFLLVAFSPIILIVSIIIRLKLGAPVIFKQERIGYQEQVFTLLKFRTMTTEKDEDGEDLSDSIRLTKVGLIIRRLSLDELPQLINVIKGEMSIVGPRPLLVRYLPYYTQAERKRHTVRPGITGYAQVEGRNNLDWDKRLALDVIYANKQSFLFDMKILLKTISKTLKQEGIVKVPDQVMLDLDEERRRKHRLKEGIE